MAACIYERFSGFVNGNPVTWIDRLDYELLDIEIRCSLRAFFASLSVEGERTLSDLSMSHGFFIIWRCCYFDVGISRHSY